jgi:hypothetical protein
LSLAQGKVAQVKIMLMPSSLDKDEKWLKEESSCQAQTYSYVFYLSLEYSSSYYKEGYNLVILTKLKCSKPREIPRVMRGNLIPRVCWNLSYWLDRYCTPVRPVVPILKQVRTTELVRSLYQIPGIFFGHVRSWTRHVRWTIWPLEFEHHQTCPALLRTCPGPNPNLSSERDFFSECPEPLWILHISLTGMVDQSDRFALIAPVASFSRFL